MRRQRRNHTSAFKAKVALEAAHAAKAEAAALRAKRVEEEERRRLHFAAKLAEDAIAYLTHDTAGAGRRARVASCVKVAVEKRLGQVKIAIPEFWSPRSTGLINIAPEGVIFRRKAKPEPLWASPEFAWAMVGRKWREGDDPKHHFRRLVDKAMPGSFDFLGARYGTDALLAESRNVLDLAFVAASWRFTACVQHTHYRCGVADWPPPEASA